MDEYKQKQSVNTSGSKNPMFGKPSPSGSGNGWSGWFKGVFFRSLKEMSFMVDNDGKFELCESKEFKIPYTLDDRNRNYFPDFKIGNKVFEIKPKKLFKTRQNSIKFESAAKWCNDRGFEFVLIDYE